MTLQKFSFPGGQLIFLYFFSIMKKKSDQKNLGRQATDLKLFHRWSRACAFFRMRKINFPSPKKEQTLFSHRLSLIQSQKELSTIVKFYFHYIIPNNPLSSHLPAILKFLKVQGRTPGPKKKKETTDKIVWWMVRLR